MCSTTLAKVYSRIVDVARVEVVRGQYAHSRLQAFVSST